MSNTITENTLSEVDTKLKRQKLVNYIENTVGTADKDYYNNNVPCVERVNFAYTSNWGFYCEIRSVMEKLDVWLSYKVWSNDGGQLTRDGILDLSWDDVIEEYEDIYDTKFWKEAEGETAYYLRNAFLIPEDKRTDDNFWSVLVEHMEDRGFHYIDPVGEIPFEAGIKWLENVLGIQECLGYRDEHSPLAHARWLLLCEPLIALFSTATSKSDVLLEFEGTAITAEGLAYAVDTTCSGQEEFFVSKGHFDPYPKLSYEDWMLQNGFNLRCEEHPECVITAEGREHTAN